ncbi:MAG TPA: ATP-binding protein [Steroidobacteraceae bacterium]|jgi:two-component system chemotaxis sensor kinase CheA|nr:ATP-binding protein [Steroidobacteraceae bacterium]
MAKQSVWSQVSIWPLVTASASAAALTALLLYGMQSARTLQATSTALQRASELSGEPQVAHSQLALLQRGLENRTYVGDSMRSLAADRDRGNSTLVALKTAITGAGLTSDTDLTQKMATVQARWDNLDLALQHIGTFSAEDLYIDTAAGSGYSGQGQQLKHAVDSSLREQAQSARQLTQDLTEVSTLLRQAVTAEGERLRGNLIGGTALAAALLGLMLYFAWSARRGALRALEAEQQIGNILGTVREGLFLIDRQGRIGGTHSASLTTLLHLETPAAGTLEDLLQPIVDQKTLHAATKYVGLLWKDKVHEDLIESVNPLSQIEVVFSKPRGKEVRYLSFSFRRARDPAQSQAFIFGVVADVTDRVLLQREVAHVKADSDAQAAALLELLKVEPSQLEAFIVSVDIGVRKANAMLGSPGKDSETLRSKIDGVFREMHALKGEAMALGLSAFARHIHAIEDLLSGLRQRTDLTGNEFVPAVVKLGELMDYRTQIIELQSRISQFRAAQAPQGKDEEGYTGVDTEVFSTLETGLRPQNTLSSLLKTLTETVAADCDRSVKLVTNGLEAVPPAYAVRVRDICVQMIRNAVVHGIEKGSDRTSNSKPATATINVAFGADEPTHYVLRVEDDGRGLNYEEILDRALRSGVVSPDKAATMKPESVFKLILEPGFTTAETVSVHAGRGVGLNMVSESLRECDGRLSIATKPGAYTRFIMRLPKAAAHEMQSSVA